VIENAATDNTTANDDGLGMSFHGETCLMKSLAVV
jgi:hypothetical protein